MSKITTCTIPLDKIDEGLSLIAYNVQYLCQDYYTLVKEGSPWHAVVMAIFALEELAKYFALKKAKQIALQSKTTNVEVDQRLFGRGRPDTHKYKLDIARREELIPPNVWTLYAGNFDRSNFDSTNFDTEEVVVSTALRTRNIFVDWRDEKWQVGGNADLSRVKQLVEAILETLSQLVKTP